MARQDDARRELARRELERRKPPEEVLSEFSSSVQEAGSKAEFIQAEPPLIERAKRKIPTTLPGVGQFIGGLAGGVMGAGVKAPLRGAAIGGVIGRTAVVTGQDVVKRGKDAIDKLISTPPENFMQLLTPKSLNEVLNPLKETGKRITGAAFSAAVTEALGAGIAGTGRKVGRGILEATLGKRVAQRGFEVGFKRLLNKENFTGRIPKAVAEKTGQFFTKLKEATGAGVQSAIKAIQGNKRTINTKSIGSEMASIKKLLGSVDDLSPATSNQQKKLIKEILSDVDSLAKKGTADVQDVWNVRQKADRVIFGKGFSDEAKEYLFSARAVLNNPIKRASPEVEKHFTRYSFVKQMEKEMEKDFRTRTVDGKIFAKRPERFAGNLLKTAKDEEIAELKQLDSFLGLEDRVIEDLLDVAAAESLDKPFELLGLPGKILSGALDFKKNLARAGGVPQMKSVSIPTAIAGRTIPTMFTDLLQEEK